MSTAAAIILFTAVTLYVIFGALIGRGLLGPHGWRHETGERPREVIDDSIGAVWEANHVWLIFSFVVCGRASRRRTRRLL